MKQISIFLPLLMILTLLQGCFGGGGGSAAVSTTNTVRLVNGTSSTLSLVTGGTQLATSVAPGTASANATITSGTYPIALVASGVPSAETNFSFAATVPYTLVAYTSDQSLHLVQFADNEPAPLAGDGQIRVADLSADAGNLDVYMAPVSALSDTYSPTAASPALQAATLLAQNVSGTTLYNEVLANTYHVWVTGANNITDLRLDIPSITIANQQILTLVLTSTTGGGLVDGLLVTQQGAVLAQKNTNARIRIAANTTSPIATATAGATAVNLIGNSTSFDYAVGSYVLVPAGSTAITINGSPASCTPVTTAGEDLTLLLTGTNACNPLVDDNTRPTSGYAKLRLVNGVNGGGAFSLAFNGVQVASNITFGTASIPTLNNQGIVNSSISASLVATPTVPTLITPVVLNSQGVYSLFLLGTSGTPTGTLIQDH
ncbi:alginate O-acetyl transferase AlgF [mine drainage metagenome]|uniref:Alginate O-acetyl transferase AlgF n=1 Tax=mine drainage metagenome TaxID=410659 RepID=A0A1J5RVD9_9ZZZZ